VQVYQGVFTSAWCGSRVGPGRGRNYLVLGIADRITGAEREALDSAIAETERALAGLAGVRYPP